jgi:Gas vesicle synthesis protein GvpL/GvpF
MPILLYCVTQPAPAVDLAIGICDSAVESREMLGVRVYFSDVQDAETCLGSPESSKQSALQFHNVLREILKTATPIPFRFPTLLDSSENLEQHLASEGERYREALARVEGAVQYDIVATWTDNEQADSAAPVSGREYLKRRQQTAERITAVESKLKGVTADSVREWRGRRERKTYRWFALVPRDCRESFLASLRGAGGGSSPSGLTPGSDTDRGMSGVRLRLSGPWPPSEFVAPRGEHG